MRGKISFTAHVNRVQIGPVVIVKRRQPQFIRRSGSKNNQRLLGGCMKERYLCVKSGQVIELYDRVLRKPLAQIISQGSRLARVPRIGKGQRQAVIHISPRRTSLRESGLLSCSTCISEQRFP